MKKKILFIINPISGGRSKQKLPKTIEENLDHQRFEYRISFTERVEHAYMLSKAAVKEGYDIVVAVGGDGTVNEVAKGILNTDLILGIIPFGSGNGLARSLRIPMKSRDAVKIINQHKVERIDTATINGLPFFNMAGSGFDASISHRFASLSSRGFLGYMKSTISELLNYKSDTYQFQMGETVLNQKAFIVSIANSSQYGNEAHIAPLADVKDGLLDLVIVKPFPWYTFPWLVFKMFTKTAHLSKYVASFQLKEVVIKRSAAAPIHIDGEPRDAVPELAIEIVPQSMSILVPYV